MSNQIVNKHSKSIGIALNIAPLLNGLTEKEVKEVLAWIPRAIQEEQKPLKLNISTALNSIKQIADEYPECY